MTIDLVFYRLTKENAYDLGSYILSKAYKK